MSTSSSVGELVRIATRDLVRELGFGGGSFADTALSASAVHALIEIDAHDGITTSGLAAILRLEQSSVSQMLHKLVLSGDVTETALQADGSHNNLSLSPAGRRRVAEINSFTKSQVSGALDRLRPGQELVVLDGLRIYAEALRGRECPSSSSQIEITPGYRTGSIARITEMHAINYARSPGFGQEFECVVANSLAAFFGRPENPQNAIWTAVRGSEIVGSVAIDGEHLGPGIAHLRYFIVDDSARGKGIGKRLLSAALAFADDMGFAETRLWTFSGLDAARSLYEANGFSCVSESAISQWGLELLEQWFVRKNPGR